MTDDDAPHFDKPLTLLRGWRLTVDLSTLGKQDLS